MNMNAFRLGQAVRAYLAGRGAGSKTPVAFLYNGVRLPKLPESEYQYAVVAEITGGYCYLYLCSSEVVTPAVISDGYEAASFKESGAYATYFNDPTGKMYDANTWTKTDERTNSAGATLTSVRFLKWASYDILREDGAVYLAKSAPIPVYE